MIDLLEVVGVFAFALSGAALAVRRNFDIVGILMLAVITAVGGGVLRDVLLGDVPPAAFTEWEYFAAPVAAAGLTFLFHELVERVTLAVLVLDAAGLGLFCIAGTVKALEYGLGVLPATALGVTTGVGGGLLRDIVARETPMLVDPTTQLYAIPAMAGALAVAVMWHLEVYTAALGTAVALAIVAVRLLALAHDWRAPTARARR